MTEADTSDRSRSYVVQAIERGGRVLDLVQRSPMPLSLTELTVASGLSTSTTFRMLRSLEYIGLVERTTDGDRYRLGLRCVALGQTYLDQVDFRREALPFLEQLRGRFNETVHLGVLDQNLRVMYLEKVEGGHPIGMMSRVGHSAPSYCTGLGKVLLATDIGDPVEVLTTQGPLERKTPNTICDPDELRSELATIAERGFSVDLEEHEVGVRCVAAPVVDSTGRTVAGISIAGPSQRLSKADLYGDLAQATMQAAHDISYRLGGGEGRR